VITRQVTKQHVSVLMFDSKGREMVRWNFHNAYPVKWVGPQFTADGRTAAIETLELTHDGIELG
jgi:phage tail-like protein